MPASLTYSPVPHAPATAGTWLAPTRGYAQSAQICVIQKRRAVARLRK